jgi:hypothetical protein
LHTNQFEREGKPWETALFVFVSRLFRAKNVCVPCGISQTTVYVEIFFFNPLCSFPYSPATVEPPLRQYARLFRAFCNTMIQANFQAILCLYWSCKIGSSAQYSPE